jgi:hypothetical protein
VNADYATPGEGGLLVAEPMTRVFRGATAAAHRDSLRAVVDPRGAHGRYWFHARERKQWPAQARRLQLVSMKKGRLSSMKERALSTLSVTDPG